MMDPVSAYSLATFAWTSAQALPLIIWPSLVSSLLTPEYQPSTSVERYFARSLGFAQLSVGLLVVVLSGVLPLASSVDVSSDAASPYGSAVVLISSLYHGAAAFYSYMRFHESGQTGFIMGCVGSSFLSAFGLWTLMFGGTGRISKRTGADKRTSGFPFKNAEAQRKKGKAL